MGVFENLRTRFRLGGKRPEDVVGQVDSINPPTPQSALSFQQNIGQTSTETAINPPAFATEVSGVLPPTGIEQTEDGGVRVTGLGRPTTEDGVPLKLLTDSIGFRPEQANLPGRLQDKVITIDTKEGGQETITLTPREYESWIKGVGMTGRSRLPTDADSAEMTRFLELRRDLEDWNKRFAQEEAGQQATNIAEAQFEAQFPGQLAELEFMPEEMTFEEAQETIAGARALGAKGVSISEVVTLGGRGAAIGGFVGGRAATPGLIIGSIIGFAGGVLDAVSQDKREVVTNADRIRADVEKSLPAIINAVNAGGNPSEAIKAFNKQEQLLRVAQAILKEETKSKSGATLSQGLSELQEVEDMLDLMNQERTELRNAILNPDPNRMREIPAT